MKNFFLLIIFFLFWQTIIAQPEENYINIQKGIYQRIKVFVDWEKKIPKNLIKLVKKNLLWSGVFEENEEQNSIQINISIKNDKYYALDFLTKDESLLFQYLLLKTKNSNKQEQEVIKLVQKTVVRLTKKKSSLGSAIAYSEQIRRNTKKIVMTDLHNNKKITLIKDKNYNILPRWSPRGDQLIYTSLGHRGSRIILLDLKKKTRRVFIQSRLGIATGGSWNIKNNNLVVTLSNRVNHDLYLFRKTGRFKKRLTTLSSIETSPFFSPDGKWIVFSSNRSGSVQLYTLNRENNRKNRITFEGNYNTDAEWSNDGTHMLYAGRKSNIFQVYLMNFHTKQRKQLTYSRRTSEDPSWSPDDRLFVFSSKISGESKLYVMTIDGKYTRRLTNSPKGVKETNPTWTSAAPWKYF